MNTPLLPITAVVLCYNNEATLANTLSSLKLMSEVLVIDTGSIDSSLQIAASYPNVSIHKIPFNGFGLIRQKAIALASSDWVLSIDSDEVLSEAAIEELKNLSLDDMCLYSFPFHNYFHGKWIKGCGWYPDRHARLFNRLYARFSDDAVHEKLKYSSLKEVKLPSPIYHYSYHSVSDFMIKMHRYAELFAQQNLGKKKSSFFKAIRHGLFAFIKSYFIKRGYMSGKEGFMISLYNSQTSYYKYLRLWELSR